jgi:hypothetical protein
MVLAFAIFLFDLPIRIFDILNIVHEISAVIE